MASLYWPLLPIRRIRCRGVHGRGRGFGLGERTKCTLPLPGPHRSPGTAFQFVGQASAVGREPQSET